MFRYLPEQASAHAADVDWIHHIITDLSLFFTVAIVGAMLYFAFRYRKKDGKNHETPQIRGSHFLEFVWTFVPTVISIFVAYEGVRIFNEMRVVPKDAIVINGFGSQWKWDFEYQENGKRTTGELVVPVNQAVKVVLTSRDVLHSFFVPEMRVKTDAIKGQYTYVSFTPIKTGVYRSYCTEYCGKDHWNMLAELRVVPEAEYTRWVNDKTEKEVAPFERGKILYVQKGCKSCHSLDGSRVVGPSWLKIYGENRKFIDGTSLIADEEYLRESILKPNQHVLEGYAPNMMPAYDGQLSESDITGLIAFIKAQDGSAPAPAATPAPQVETAALATPEERGKSIWQVGKGAAAPCSACHSIDGSKLVGPTFKGLYGKSGKFTDGGSYTADDAYIKDSILNPMEQVVEGYAPAMPPYQGTLSDDDIRDLIAFIKTLT
jgi:cytochrome c oxidase subunit 2